MRERLAGFKQFLRGFRQENRALESPEERHIRDAGYILLGPPGEGMQLSVDPNRYLSFPPRKKDFISTESIFQKFHGSKLMYMYNRVLTLTENPEQAKDFARMVLDMPKLAPSGVIQAVYAFTFRDFHYTNELAERIRSGESPLIPEEWHTLETRKIVTTPNEMFQALSLSELAKGIDDTSEIKANFRLVLEEQSIVLE